MYFPQGSTETGRNWLFLVVDCSRLLACSAARCASTVGDVRLRRVKMFEVMGYRILVCDAIWCGIRMAIHFSEERTGSMLKADRDPALSLR